MQILLNSIHAGMKLEIGSSRFHVEEAGADAKLNQHGPLGVAYYRRHIISTVPVARITAHATVPGYFFILIIQKSSIEKEPKNHNY
jgi:hypothetical protein